MRLIKATYIGTEVTSFARDAQGDETLIWVDLDTDVTNGIDNRYYKMVGTVFTPLTTQEKLVVDNEAELSDAIDNKVQELKTELDARVDASVPKSTSKKVDKILSRLIKLVYKSSQGRASVSEIAEMDLMEALDDYLDALTDAHLAAELWLRSPSRTLTEIVAYDAKNSPMWPTA